MKLLGIKAFLRGGYREQTHSVLVVSHSEPTGLWIPIPKGKEINGTVSRRVAAVERALLEEGGPEW